MLSKKPAQEIEKVLDRMRELETRMDRLQHQTLEILFEIESALGEESCLPPASGRALAVS